MSISERGNEAFVRCEMNSFYSNSSTGRKVTRHKSSNDSFDTKDRSSDSVLEHSRLDSGVVMHVGASISSSSYSGKIEVLPTFSSDCIFAPFVATQSIR